MLYVRVELWPRGNREKAKTLGELVLCNNGGTQRIGEYLVVRSKGRGFKDPARPRTVEVSQTCALKDFPRRRLNAWDLVYRALRELVGKRNP